MILLFKSAKKTDVCTELCIYECGYQKNVRDVNTRIMKRNPKVLWSYEENMKIFQWEIFLSGSSWTFIEIIFC